jgi:serine/threonine protein phosphatase PrpC
VGVQVDSIDLKHNAAVSWQKKAYRSSEPHKDRYCMLTSDIPIVRESGRGELYAVLDGVGTATMGIIAAQTVVNCLLDFYQKPEEVPADTNGLIHHLLYTNLLINEWSCTEGTAHPLGGAAGTIAWVHDQVLTIFHAGGTAGILIKQGQKPRRLTGIRKFGDGISRYFGLGMQLELEVTSEKVSEGDMILLVSEGITKVFNTLDAANIVLEILNNTNNPAEAVRELVTRSRKRKSIDDVTAMLITVHDR